MINITLIFYICLIIFTGVVIFITAFFINYVDTEVFGKNVIESVILIVLVNILLLIIIIIARQPAHEIDLAFKVHI